MSARVATDEEKAGFRAAQRLAYRAAITVAGELREGMTERAAAALLATWLGDHGAWRFLHRPFAWFGAHSRFDGYRGFNDFHPSDAPLRPGDVAILDCSPIVDGYVADIGYTTALGEHAGLPAARALLSRLRADLPGLFASRLPTRAIWREVDRQVREAGFDNCHARYPFRVLGHRVYHVGDRGPRLERLATWRPPIGLLALSWFSLRATAAFLGHAVYPELLSPLHRGSKLGLWAIEPHVGGRGFGAKFEEILVVEPGRAYWLDDQVPHVGAAR